MRMLWLCSTPMVSKLVKLRGANPAPYKAFCFKAGGGGYKKVGYPTIYIGCLLITDVIRRRTVQFRRHILSGAFEAASVHLNLVLGLSCGGRWQ